MKLFKLHEKHTKVIKQHLHICLKMVRFKNAFSKTVFLLTIFLQFSLCIGYKNVDINYQ